MKLVSLHPIPIGLKYKTDLFTLFDSETIVYSCSSNYIDAYMNTLLFFITLIFYFII